MMKRCIFFALITISLLTSQISVGQEKISTAKNDVNPLAAVLSAAPVVFSYAGYGSGLEFQFGFSEKSRFGGYLSVFSTLFPYPNLFGESPEVMAATINPGIICRPFGNNKTYYYEIALTGVFNFGNYDSPFDEPPTTIRRYGMMLQNGVTYNRKHFTTGPQVGVGYLTDKTAINETGHLALKLTWNFGYRF